MPSEPSARLIWSSRICRYGVWYATRVDSCSIAGPEVSRTGLTLSSSLDGSRQGKCLRARCGAVIACGGGDSLSGEAAPGDEIRVIAPSCSRAMVTEHDHTGIIEARFAELGLSLSYGAHIDERDDCDSSAVASRVADLHAAFADPAVAAVMTVIGGYNSNELLPSLDWELIRTHPKIFCGYSDITALQCAILARAGLVTYCGPHWSSFGMARYFGQTLRWFTECLMRD